MAAGDSDEGILKTPRAQSPLSHVLRAGISTAGPTPQPSQNPFFISSSEQPHEMASEGHYYNFTDEETEA